MFEARALPSYLSINVSGYFLSVNHSRLRSQLPVAMPGVMDGARLLCCQVECKELVAAKLIATSKHNLKFMTRLHSYACKQPCRPTTAFLNIK